MCRVVPENRLLPNCVHRFMILVLSCVQCLVIIGSQIIYKWLSENACFLSKPWLPLLALYFMYLLACTTRRISSIGFVSVSRTDNTCHVFSACGGTLTSSSGRFVSPRYPDSYPDGVQCEWTIGSSPGNRVMLTFRWDIAVFMIGWGVSHISGQRNEPGKVEQAPIPGNTTRMR